MDPVLLGLFSRLSLGELNTLARAGVLLVGRYGRWEYAAMEDALLQGMEAAAALRPETAAGEGMT